MTLEGEHIARFSVCLLFLCWQFWSLVLFEYFLSTQARNYSEQVMWLLLISQGNVKHLINVTYSSANTYHSFSKYLCTYCIQATVLSAVTDVAVLVIHGSCPQRVPRLVGEKRHGQRSLSCKAVDVDQSHKNGTGGYRGT